MRHPGSVKQEISDSSRCSCSFTLASKEVVIIAQGQKGEAQGLDDNNTLFYTHAHERVGVSSSRRPTDLRGFNRDRSSTILHLWHTTPRIEPRYATFFSVSPAAEGWCSPFPSAAADFFILFICPLHQAWNHHTWRIMGSTTHHRTS